MNNNSVLKLERACRDRDFYILNKDRIIKSYEYLEALLSSYIDICCHIFKTFKVNKTSYVYGSVATLAVGIVLCKEKFFAGALGSDPIENLARDIFPMFVEQYNSTTIVESKTQSHMVRGYIEDFEKIAKKTTKYIPGIVDSYLPNEVSDLVKSYLNQIVRYCGDRRCEGFDLNNVIEELLPYLKTICF